MAPNLHTNPSKRHRILLSCAVSKKPRQENDADVAFRALSVKDLRARRIFGEKRDLGFQIEDPNKLGFVDFGSDRNGENESDRKLGDFKGDEDLGIGQKTDSASGFKLVVKASFSKKVFKVPGSNRYRKLLPFLMNMAKDDTHSLSELPCIPKAEENGLGTINSNGTEPELPEVIGNLSLSNDEDQNAHSDGLKILECEEIKNSPTELSCENKHFDVLSLPKTQGVAQLEGNQKGIKKSKSLDGADAYAEELAVLKIDEMDLGVSSKVLNSIGSKSMNPLNSNDPEGEAEGVDCANPLENGEMNDHLSCEALDTDQLNLSGMEEGVLLDNEDQKRNENGGSSNGADEYGENIQTTPPDMDISNLEMNMVEIEENQKRKIAIEDDSFTCGTTSNGNICLKNGSNSKRKVILNPCSRRKIFKTPGSFSYRRLLPYLNDVSGDNHHYTLDASEYPPRPKAKNYSEEKKPNKDLPMVDLQTQQIPVSKSEASYSSTKHAEGDLELDPPNFTSDSSDDKLPLTSAEKSNELQKPFDSPDKCMIPLDQVISNIIKSLEPASGGEIPKTEIASPDFKLCSSGDNKNTHRYDAHVVSHSEINSSQAKTARDSLIKESFSENPGNNSKGILKRNPRGCRGLCSCLNCTSFRLHADRAFEFSRNQMLDAEELAVSLIKEVSALRNMLKESTVNSQGQTTTNIDQVMAACSNALKVEESAKCRLKEMRCDLSIHCRSKPLERPRVRFANHVNEMVIPEVELPAGDEKVRQIREPNSA